MKVLIVNTQTEGGAAKSCLRLVEGLETSSEHQTDLLILRTKSRDQYQSNCFDRQRIVLLDGKVPGKVRRKLDRYACKLRGWNHQIPDHDLAKKLKKERLRRGLDYFSTPITPFDITQSRVYKDSELVNLHWVADFLDYPSFFRKNKKPVVWTLHDMSPFLGGEHYAEWYDDVLEDGVPRHRTYSETETELFDRITSFKKQVFDQVTNLQIVCPSKWLYEEAKKSAIFGRFKVHHIPYGIDTNTFKPIDRHSLRDKLSIHRKDKVLLFVADSLASRRKGMVYLLKALEKLASAITLISVGGEFPGLKKMEHVRHIHLGRIEKEQQMADIYNAADFFVIPSLMDNLPNTVIESLCCGTPVIGFPVGGIVDMVNPQNGILTPEISVSALADAIRSGLDPETNFERKMIAAEAQKKFASNVQAKRYWKLFKSAMHDNRS